MNRTVRALGWGCCLLLITSSAHGAQSVSARVGYRKSASAPIQAWLDLTVSGVDAKSKGACGILVSAALSATTGNESSVVLRACAPEPLPAFSVCYFGYVLWERLHQAGRDLVSPLGAAGSGEQSKLADEIASGKIIAHETRARWFLSAEACAREKATISRPLLRRYIVERAKANPNVQSRYEKWLIPDPANLVCKPLPLQKPALIRNY